MRVLKTFLFPLTAFLFMLPGKAFPKEIQSNAATFQNSPDWLTTNRVNKDIEAVQNFMEWDIRKIKVIFYDKRSADAFKRIHGFGDSVMAVSIKNTMTIHLGPRISEMTFDEYFEHELVHIVLFQKYKNAVPNWLDEGLANYVSKHGKVNYNFVAHQISKRGFSDFETLTHPYVNQDGDFWLFHYQASTALVEMIAARCNLKDLLQLSVGKKFETYLATTCEVSNINSDFLKWVDQKNKASMKD